MSSNWEHIEFVTIEHLLCVFSGGMYYSQEMSDAYDKMYPEYNLRQYSADCRYPSSPSETEVLKEVNAKAKARLTSDGVKVLIATWWQKPMLEYWIKMFKLESYWADPASNAGHESLDPTQIRERLFFVLINNTGKPMEVLS
jgi:hypothetical protein